MLLAVLLPTIKAFWSLLVASALIWSGVDLTGSLFGNGTVVSKIGSPGQPGFAEQGVADEDNEGVPRSSGVSPLSLPGRNENVAEYFNTDEDYRVLTRYGSPTEITLANYLSDGTTGIMFSLASCDANREDYYRSVAVQNDILKLESNTLGHVHGPSTQTETVCAVTASGDEGSQSQEFSLYTVSDRTPQALPDGALTVNKAGADEIDVHVDMPGTSPG